jgi:preprotein translocase subunit SecB
MIDPTNSGLPPGGVADPAASIPAGSVAVSVITQYLKDLSFESPRAPEVFRQSAQQPPKVQVNVDVKARTVGQDHYEVVLILNAEAKINDAVAFVVEAEYAGLFAVQGLTQEQMGPFLLIECPRLLFPFLRQIVSDATRNGGFPPLMISPIDFLALYRRQARAAAEAGAPASAVPN